MLAAGVYLDTNLLVLLVVGDTGTDLIMKHRRLRAFSVEDYDRLVRMVGLVGSLLVTPNILTEASNLLAQHGDPERSRFFDTLRSHIEDSAETVVPSRAAARNSKFRALGLTDAALLEVVSPHTPLVTVDLDLYGAALAKGREAAFNFRHSQPW